MGLFSRHVTRDNTPTKQNETAKVAIDGAGIVSVKSKDILQSARGQSQLQATANVHLLKRDTGNL